MINGTAQELADEQQLAKPISGSCSLTYRRNVAIQTVEGPAIYWGEIENGKRHGKGTTLWSELKCEHSGQYANGNMEGDGYWRVTRAGNGWARFTGKFKGDCPVSGVWQEVCFDCMVLPFNAITALLSAEQRMLII